MREIGKERPRGVDDRNKKLRELVKQRAADNFDRGSFLQSNATFDHGCTFADDEAVRRSEKLLELLMAGNFSRRRDWNQKKTDIEILCANLLVNKSSKSLAISLNRNHYAPSKYIIASYFTTKLVKLMAESGWIEQAKGNQKMERMTRIWPTQKLVDYFKPFEEVDFRPLELVVLKDKKGKFCIYENTPETEHIRQVLLKVNLVNREALVQLKTRQGFQRLNTDLHAVFNNSSWEQGGRLWTGKGGYQSLHKEERQDIWINHEKTVEHDFSGMQPRLLYALEGIQYPLEDDPYTAVIEDYPELRPFAKQLLLALLNAQSMDKAIASGNYVLFQDYDLYRTIQTIGTRTIELVERFKQAHPDIAKHFGTAMGLKLQRIDARIALDVVEHFTSRNIPILAIHDSFIVQQRWENELHTVMAVSYQKHTGGFDCPIKQA